MKRSSGINIDEISQISSKVYIFEESDIDEKMETNSFETSTAVEAENSSNNTFSTFNTLNKMDGLGRQFKGSQQMTKAVLCNAELNVELNSASCSFVKRPGHIYHLYERFPGNKYLSMLSPEEWEKAPHKYIGSWKLQKDCIWIDPQLEKNGYDGLQFLEQYECYNPNIFTTTLFNS